MYLAHIHAENFRIFGSRAECKHLDLELRPGLNVLVGENDSGKTCVMGPEGTLPYFGISGEAIRLRRFPTSSRFSISSLGFDWKSELGHRDFTPLDSLAETSVL
jgi:hypothetical protein